MLKDNINSQIITQQEIIDAQHLWANAIIAIGHEHHNNGDYARLAEIHIKTLYAYDFADVLFKPTLASEKQFRNTYEEALSYFIGGQIKEDSGFAIKPWSQIRFGEQNFIIENGYALAMGNYFFIEADQIEEIKVEFTFGYIKDTDGKLRINLHHSSLPYQKNNE